MSREGIPHLFTSDGAKEGAELKIWEPFLATFKAASRLTEQRKASPHFDTPQRKMNANVLSDRYKERPAVSQPTLFASLRIQTDEHAVSIANLIVARSQFLSLREP
jgi:hypothetical protein